VAEIARHRQRGGWQFGRGHAPQGLAGLRDMPAIAPGVGDHGRAGFAERLRHEVKTAIDPDRSRGEQAPGAHRHRRRADAEDRARTFAQDVAAESTEIHAEVLDTRENGHARLLLGSLPAGVAGGGPHADLHASGRRVDDEQRRVGGEKNTETRHGGARQRRALPWCKRAKSSPAGGRGGRIPVGWNVAALERSDNVADRGHAFAVLKRGYTHREVLIRKTEMRGAARPP
jgi:hypothetical protein